MPFDKDFVGQFAQLLGQESQHFAAIRCGRALPLSKNVPDSDSVSSIRNPSLVMVISMWFLRLSKFGTWRVAFSSSSLSFGMSSFVKLKFLPDPVCAVPTRFEVPVGSLKYPPTASWTCLLLFISHKTMKSAIIAVTKSA